MYEITCGPNSRTFKSLVSAYERALIWDEDSYTDPVLLTDADGTLLLSVDAGMRHLAPALETQIEALRLDALAAGDKDLASACVEALEDEDDSSMLAILDALDNADVMKDYRKELADRLINEIIVEESA